MAGCLGDREHIIVAGPHEDGEGVAPQNSPRGPLWRGGRVHGSHGAAVDRQEVCVSAAMYSPALLCVTMHSFSI